MENKRLKPLLDYLKVFDELYENAGPDERALTWGYHNLTCGELRAAIAEIERLQNSERSYAADYEAAMAKLSTATSERRYWRDIALLREQTIGILLDERDEARRWTARLYRAAKCARMTIRESGELTSVTYDDTPDNWREYMTPAMLDAYDALDRVLGRQARLHN